MKIKDTGGIYDLDREQLCWFAFCCCDKTERDHDQDITRGEMSFILTYSFRGMRNHCGGAEAWQQATGSDAEQLQEAERAHLQTSAQSKQLTGTRARLYVPAVWPQ